MPRYNKPVSAETVEALGKMATTAYFTSTTLSTAVHVLMRRCDYMIKCVKKGMFLVGGIFLYVLTPGLAADVFGAHVVLADGGICVFHQVVVSGAFEVRAVLF